jgi:hypothetical protein
MAEKSAKELGEILSGQLDELTKKTADDFTVKKADSIANQVGKMLKLAALELVYAQQKKAQAPDLPSLTR